MSEGVGDGVGSVVFPGIVLGTRCVCLGSGHMKLMTPPVGPLSQFQSGCLALKSPAMMTPLPRLITASRSAESKSSEVAL
jgi:hypothetical protein